MGDAKFKLEDILNKQKAQPQILDLTNVKIESEEDFKGVIEKIPDYKIKPERVSYQFHSNKRLLPICRLYVSTKILLTYCLKYISARRNG